MYLGVDGGGTKTAFVLTDESGEVRGSHEADGVYYLDIGLDPMRARLEAGVRRVASEAGIALDDIRFAFFGLPAYGEDPAVTGTLDELPASLLPRRNYRCGNDMVCAWAGSLGCQDGINLVAGTGSIAYGRRAEREARSGGWGEFFGDEGSAYWIARRGLRLFAKMSDGRATPGPLLELVRRNYRLVTDLALSPLVLEQWAPDRHRVAAFARIVTAAAREGDRQAAGILAEAGAELAVMADAVRRQLRFAADERVAVSWSGGVIDAGDLVLAPLVAHLASLSANFEFVIPRCSPALGAAYYAALLDGSDRIRARLAAGATA
jgi:N-acetylglucosamine kinase-like BadF-type ATPase